MDSLKSHNTFGVEAYAKSLHIISKRSDLESFHFKSVQDYFILGGGSNMLLTRNIEVPVLKNEIKGIRVVQQSVDHVWVQCGGGEIWHDFVLWTLEQKFAGLENLSLIPGTSGAAPIQNIGAYGVELSQSFYQLSAYDMLKKELVSFNAPQCEFNYRDSFFKKPENKGRYFITHITLKLSKDFHQVNTSYGAIKNVLAEQDVVKPTAQDVSKAVIEIRKSKLPDPSEIGNSGSFFKNPIVNKSTFEVLQKNYPNMPYYHVSEDEVKIPAGWLIEQCGWKGKRVGETGNYKHQALIIVNHGAATGAEIYTHAVNVQQSVLDEFNIALEMEVNII